ncbi:MAG: DUF4139 domain-containing protein [bacterium]
MKLQRTTLFTFSTLMILLLGLIFVGPDSAATQNVKTTSDDQTEIAITIYNDGTGLVKDTRTLDLPDGQFDLIFMDVASSIDPTSVRFVSIKNPDAITVLEQNYEYDLVNSAALFQKYVDKEITVRTEDGRVISGTLLSNADGLILQTDEGIMVLNNAVETTFEKLPEGLITRPTLRWSLLNSTAGNHDCEMMYLTSGMGWNANYVAVVSQNDDKLDLSGWVTINNNSGTAYHDALLKLVAGEIHRVQPQYQKYAYDNVMMAEGGGAEDYGFQEESFFEYHLYTLQQPATVLNNQQKQISLLEGEGIGAQKILVFDPGYAYSYSGDTAKGTIKVNLKFRNSEQNGLGIPLPKGTIRVYKKDASGSLQFIGEDSIDHTPKDEDLEIFLGEAFDITGERVVLDRRMIRDKVWEYDVKVTIRNHKTESIRVKYDDNVYGDWEVRTSSLDWKQKDASTIEFEIPVAVDGETSLTYTIRKQW